MTHQMSFILSHFTNHNSTTTPPPSDAHVTLCDRTQATTSVGVGFVCSTHARAVITTSIRTRLLRRERLAPRACRPASDVARWYVYLYIVYIHTHTRRARACTTVSGDVYYTCTTRDDRTRGFATRSSSRVCASFGRRARRALSTSAVGARASRARARRARAATSTSRVRVRVRRRRARARAI